MIVGLMQRLSGEPVRTFSIGFPVAEYDETRYARIAAEAFGTVHEEFQVEPNAVEVLDELVWHFDEPFADSSAVPTWYVSRLTRQHVTVALTGDGGDELFVGYPRYRAVRLGECFDRLPQPLRRILAGRYWQTAAVQPAAEVEAPPLEAVRRGAGPIARAAVPGLDLDLQRGPARRTLQRRVRGGAARRRPDRVLWSAAAARRGSRPGDDDQPADLVTYLPCDLMTKVDIASMAHGLECRPAVFGPSAGGTGDANPAAVQVSPRTGETNPAGRLCRSGAAGRSGGGRKWGLACRWMHGFAARWPVLPGTFFWMPGTTSAGLSSGRRSCPRLLEDHQAGRFDHSYRLWALLVFELWQRRWIDGR